ncbi:hypothetical protein C8A01DRAFT_20496 [Parachaetomium inaequale]|uniref:Uncharacterized protein n=1 Tax=Parachaetomium inaequale TaxID=2588326 RepID=A0AAN6P676_9PEZI|nr:hypothetical protein C8A01DRAFT_20496 [Parachaetomium inaequale]
MNSKFNPQQAKVYCDTLAKYGLPSDAWSSEAALAARLPSSSMKQLFKYGPIGAHLRWLWMRQELKFFWDPFNWPFMEHLNIDWYVRTRLGLDDDTPEFKNVKQKLLSNPTFNTAMPLIKVIAYDCCAAVGAVGDDFMRNIGVLKEEDVPPYNRPAISGHPHMVFGKSAEDQGGIDTDRLRLVMETFLLGGLMSTHKAAEKLIPRDTIKHETVAARVVMSVFKDKMGIREHKGLEKEFQAKADAAMAENKMKDYQRFMNQVEDAKAKVKQLENKVRKAEGLTKDKEIAMPPRADIPYEQLYQEAMAAVAPKKKRVMRGLWFGYRVVGRILAGVLVY